MAKQRIRFQTISSTSVDLDVPDDLTDPHDIVNWAYEQGIDFPTLCHQCTGGRHGAPPLELGDEWEPFTENGVPVIGTV